MFISKCMDKHDPSTLIYSADFDRFCIDVKCPLKAIKVHLQI